MLITYVIQDDKCCRQLFLEEPLVQQKISITGTFEQFLKYKSEIDMVEVLEHFWYCIV